MDALFNQYATTTAKAQQQQIVDQLQQVMLKDVPVIPMTEAVDWYQYNTGKFRAGRRRATRTPQPAAYNVPDMEQVLLHLRSRHSSQTKPGRR